MFSVKQLQAFLAIVEAGNFQAASRQLNTTQPAISKRIAELEAALGVRLFERTTRQCHVTPRGRALVHYARQMLDDIGEIQRTVGERSVLAGHVRLGIIESVALAKFPALLRALARDFPQLRIHTEVGTTRELLRRLHSHELDIAMIVAPIIEQELAIEPFCEMEVSWIATGSNWNSEPLTIEKLAEHQILIQSGNVHYPIIEGWLRSKGIRAKPFTLCNSVTIAVKMVAANLGISLVPVELAQMEIDAGLVTRIPVTFALPPNPVATVYSPKQIDPSVSAVIDTIRGLSSQQSSRSRSSTKMKSR